MRHFFALVIPLFLSSAVFAADPGDLCSITDKAVSDASAIRGLKIKQRVPCLTKNKEEVKKYLLGTIQTKIPAERLSREGLVYKALGFIPFDYPYEEGVVKLYLDQLGGYYDPEMDHFVMAQWMPAILQVPVAVHELTHALQDQYFDLSPLMDPKKFSGDELMAHSALVEGDATAVMTDYSRQLMGQVEIAKEESVASIMMQNILGTGLIAASQNAPASILNMMVFPYTSGLRFAHSLLRKGGYREIDRAFKKLPRSTEEILHPEKYPAKDGEFIDVPDPEDVLESADTRQIIFRDTLGEFAISTLLSMFMTDKQRCANGASGWGGDTVVVYSAGGSKDETVVWRINWDTQSDAEEFFKAYSEVIKLRGKNHIRAVGADGLSTKLENNSELSLRKEGSTTTVFWQW